MCNCTISHIRYIVAAYSGLRTHVLAPEYKVNYKLDQGYIDTIDVSKPHFSHITIIKDINKQEDLWKELDIGTLE